MTSSFFFVAFLCVAAFTVSRGLASPLYSSSPASSSLVYRTVSQACGGFEGNSDLYGLGIRLGVYLQWISSWLVQTLNPSGIMTTHDANSIFVLAILTAMLSATARGDIKPIESYIMLLICFGYFFTVLSIFGVRVHFANPSDLSKFLHRIKSIDASLESRAADWENFWAQFAGITWSTARLRTLAVIILDLWKVFKVKISFGIASYIRHPAVSWAGVAWRTFIAGGLFTFNFWFWWSSFISQWEATNSPSCYEQIYFFGTRPLNDGTVTTLFFKVSCIILIIPVAFLISVLYNIMFAMFRFTRDFIYRKFFVTLIELIKPGAWDNLSDRKKTSIGITLALYGAPGTNPLSAILDVMLESVTDNKFWTVNKADIPPLKDVLAGYVQLLSRGMEVESEILGDSADGREPGKKSTALCLIAHSLTLVAIALFIFFIEATISISNISGVYTINTTGQLIPFVIGVTSTAAALRDLLLLWLRRRYPYWSAMEWEAVLGPGSYRIRLVKVVPNGEPTGSQYCPREASFQKEDGAWS